MNWSRYQRDVFDAVANTNDSLLIKAVAGAGKSSTIIEAVKHVPRDKNIVFLAFNKSIAKVLESKINAPNAKCSTLHAFGFSAWRRHIGDAARMLRVEGGKTREILYEEDRYEFQERMWYGREIGRLISLMKSSDLQNSPTSEYDEIIKDLVEFHDLDDEVWDNNGISFARDIFKISVDISRKVIDFDDMLLMPVMEGARFDKFDVVFVDEAQDVNAIQIEMIDRMVAPGGRVIAVGDENQAIYSWRGALSDSMDQIQKRFHSRSLPLSISYRCPRAVVAKARQFVTHIEPHESAPEGLVHYPGVWNLKNFLPTDAILCRVARPLIETAFLLIRNRVPCRVVGRDIGKNLENVVKKSRCVTVGEFEDWLPEATKHDIKKAKDNEAKIAAIYDKAETLNVFTSELRHDDPIQKLLDSINNLFADKYGQMVSLSTVHKAKGLEFPRVFILDADKYMPSKWATQPHQIRQELNLAYVAATRAMSELYYISSEFLRDTAVEVSKKEEVGGLK
jgi:superfamily I DNA/RNA helicase